MRISDWSSDVCSSDLEAGTAYLIRQYPTMTSSQGLVTAEAIAFLLWITVPVFVLVVLLIVYSMIRFRVADDDEEPSAAQYRSGQAFPWGWVAVSTILNVLFIFHPGITGLSSLWSMAEAASDPLGRGHCQPMRIGIQDR